jgi:hypothetical protein
MNIPSVQQGYYFFRKWVFTVAGSDLLLCGACVLGWFSVSSIE